MGGGGVELLHAGGDGRSNGVGIVVSEEISKTVVKVERWKVRIVMVWLMIRKEIICVMYVYGPQTGRMEAEKEEFIDALERTNNKFQMTSGQGSHWLIESPTILLSICSPPFSDICQFYF